jgi:hypothetical protein
MIREINQSKLPHAWIPLPMKKTTLQNGNIEQERHISEDGPFQGRC